MPVPRVDSRPTKRGRSRLNKFKSVDSSFKGKRVDAATMASAIQLREEKREIIYSFMALTMKLGLLALGVVSLLKLGVASHKRLGRYAEISRVLNGESVRLVHLQKRFDTLFTIGGDHRLMDEQDQWIAPNRVRVIWR